jgi:hypothetical protein
VSFATITLCVAFQVFIVVVYCIMTQSGNISIHRCIICQCNDDQHLKTGGQPSAEVSCTSDIPQTAENTQDNIGIITKYNR